MTSARGREGQESKDQEIHQENDGFREARHEERSQAVAEYLWAWFLRGSGAVKRQESVHWNDYAEEHFRSSWESPCSVRAGNGSSVHSNALLGGSCVDVEMGSRL